MRRHSQSNASKPSLTHRWPWVIGAALLAAAAPEARAADTVVPGPLPACTSQQTRRWDEAVNDSLGVAAKDPGGWIIGYWPQLGHRWDSLNHRILDVPGVFRPWGPAKTTACGLLDDFFFYDGLGAEADWNLNLVPSASYDWLLSDVESLPGVELHAPCHGARCMQLEITPDRTYYSNSWFPKDCNDYEYYLDSWGQLRTGCADDPRGHNQRSPVELTSLCAYGPWVGDHGHDGRPEIHPAELLWWRSGTSHYLMMVQDDSNRFDRPSHFYFGPEYPPGPFPGWRPWSMFPRQGKFRVAFAVDPAAGPGRYEVRVVDHRAVLLDDTDSDDGSDHRLVVGGAAILDVAEKTLDNHVQVGFEDLCRRPDGRTAGFVSLTSSLGTSDLGGEGYQLLRLDRFFPIAGEPAKPPLAALARPPVTLALQQLRATLRPMAGPDGPRLVADAVIELAGEAATADDLTIAAIERTQGDWRLPVDFTASGPGVALVQGLPLGDGMALEVRTASGRLLQLRAAAVQLGARFARGPSTWEEAPGGWPTFLAAAGAGVGDSLPTATLRRATVLGLTVDAHYAALREGAPSAEDETPLTEELNETVTAGTSERLQGLFGSPRPFSVSWSFSAHNLSRDLPAKVVVGQSAPAAVSVLIGDQGAVAGGAIEVRFPVGGELFELVAKATVSDPYGTAAYEVQERFSSHGLTGAPGPLAETALTVAAAQVGVEPARLLDAARLDLVDPDPRRCPRWRRAAVARSATINGALDGVVGPRQLAQAIAAVSAFAATPLDGDPDCQPANQPPRCDQAVATPDRLWPPSRKLVPITVAGLSDPDGDPVRVRIDAVTQDEPVGKGPGCADAAGQGTATALVRAEREGAAANGRVYRLAFTAEDGKGGACHGTVAVCVPHDQGRGDACVDDGGGYVSTSCP